MAPVFFQWTEYLREEENVKIVHIFLGLFLAIWAMINFLQTRAMIWVIVAGISLSLSYTHFKKYK